MTFNFIHLLQASSNVISCTAVQQQTITVADIVS